MLGQIKQLPVDSFFATEEMALNLDQKILRDRKDQSDVGFVQEHSEARQDSLPQLGSPILWQIVATHSTERSRLLFHFADAPESGAHTNSRIRCDSEPARVRRAILHGEFTTNDRANIFLPGGRGKSLDAINAIAIKQSHRWHLERCCGFRQIFRERCAPKKTESAARMELDVRHGSIAERLSN